MNSAHIARANLPSGFQVEARRFRILIESYLTERLNRLFDLTQTGGARRRLRVLFYAVVIAVLAFGIHAIWQLQSGLGVGTQGSSGLGAMLPAAFLMGLRIILIFGIAFSVGLHASGRFLADIFELPDVRVAWKYISGLAGGTGEEVIHLREGRIIEQDQGSPIAQIGGPGRVIVDYDTAALFEKPDGTPHVVGNASSNAEAVLEGFERLREPLINLRDQYIGHPSGEPLTVLGRSLDGMPISVTDVRGVFSIRRDLHPTNAEPAGNAPYPFRPRDIERLIYNQPVPVLTGGEFPSGLPEDWTTVMQTLIRDSLREFMSENRLAEYIAGVGAHEAESSEYRADTILSKTLQVSREFPERDSPAASSPPSFHPRTELSAKFKKYGSEFSTRAQELGLELHWIGVGTWKMPDESSEAAVGEKHRDAWRMNRENAQRSETQALQRVAEAALLEAKIRLVQDVPINRHAQNKAKYTAKAVLMECMLQDFWEQLGDALDLQYRNGNTSTEVRDLEESVLMLEHLLNISAMSHMLGGATVSRVRKGDDRRAGLDGPPAPTSRAEAEKYQALLGKLDGDYKVAEAMISNERRRHGDLNREQLIARIVERFQRHGR